MVFNKARTRMKETQKRHCKQKSAFETNRTAPLLSVLSQATGLKATPLECPFMAERPGPTLDYCLTAGSGGKWEDGNARGQT